MTGLKLSKLAATVATAVLLTTEAMAQGDAKQQPVASAGPVKRLIVVSLEDRKLALVEDGRVKKVYTVAVGKPSTPSPVGTFTIERRVANPTYRHDGKTVLPGPGNPVGTRWMGLSIHGYGIHGTNQPKSIGKAASHGCIRMSRTDLEEFYDMVAVGDTVELVGQRNAETAQLFGDGPNPAAPAAQAVRTAIAASPAANPSPSSNGQSGASANPAASAIAVLLAMR
jgi:lipoprotein-anchoring transpeptidase ErfK/SrfK